MSRFICILYPYLEMLYRKENRIFRNSIGTLIESILKAYINLNGRLTEKISSGKTGIFVWHFNCDFVAGDVRDIEVIDSSNDECGIKCHEMSECTHFTWNGKGILKIGPASEDFAYLGGAIWGKLKNI